MSWLLVVLRDALPYLACGYPHDRVIVGVVMAWSRENIDAKGSLLQCFCLSRQGLFDDKP